MFQALLPSHSLAVSASSCWSSLSRAVGVTITVIVVVVVAVDVDVVSGKLNWWAGSVCWYKSSRDISRDLCKQVMRRVNKCYNNITVITLIILVIYLINIYSTNQIPVLFQCILGNILVSISEWLNSTGMTNWQGSLPNFIPLESAGISQNDRILAGICGAG